MVTTPEPGLDLATLRGMRQASTRSGPSSLEQIGTRIRDHLAHHDGYVAFSGGKDSLVALDLARRADPDVPVVFFDSGLEYPETYDYIRELAVAWQLDLHVIAAEPPLLDALVASGLWDHSAPHADARIDLHDILIGAPARRAHEMFGPGELWGVRADESAGRRHLYTRGGRRDGIITRTDGTIAYGPIWNWTTQDVWAHISRNQLPVNPVYDVLTRIGVPPAQHRLSHLIDGAHLDRGRLTWLRRGWPQLYEQLADALPRIRHMT
ncbi:phosphoadenosine phosphosulfate reductase family protein [Rhodococcus sp. USK13]|uniref:phosphoadenosine phosphosulfate reductase domain-containing protein n=1 Tax=Rhodococcus sp. USK13 TaxID=2806442 RepID=UPI001BCE69CD|nr:phosphoadenosine phosphosulfate reductase family protein [Rhodococcus sp. USK13]